MAKIQIEIDEKTDRDIRIYMAYNDIESKSNAIHYILNEYFILRPPKYEKK